MNDDELDRTIADFSVHSRDAMENKEQLFRRMREKRCPVSSAYGGFHIISRYQDLYDAEHRHDLFSSFPVTIPAFGNPVPMIPIEMDPPVHTKYRKVVGAQFSLASIGAREDDIRKVVAELFDELAGQTEIDLVKSLGLPVPVRVIGELFLAIPPESRSTLFDQVIIQLSPNTDEVDEEKVMQRRAAAGEAIQRCLAGLLEERRQKPGSDLISFLTQAEQEGVRLTDEEILGFLLLLVPAGFDTTASTLGRTFLYLCEHPEAWRRLVEHPELLGDAIEEFLRFTTSVTTLARTVTQDCEFAGSEFRKGDRVALLWASGNRDESVFDNPDEIVLDRSPNRHLAFGSGQHRCLGSHLARAMVRITLEELLRRVSDMRLVPERPPVWHTGETWGLSSLPVILGRPL